jgi:hypothetical protein
MANDVPDWSSTTVQLDVPLTGSPIAYTNGTVTKTFTIPTGVHMISIVVPKPGDISFMNVLGSSTNARYLQANPSIGNTVSTYYATIPYTVDGQVTINIVANTNGNAYVSGVTAPLAIASLPQNPAPWQAPNQKPIGVNFGNPGQNAASVILPARTDGLTYWLHTFEWIWTSVAANVFGQWQMTDGTVIGYEANIAAGTPRYIDFKGAALNQAVGLEFFQTGSGAANGTFVDGILTYSVY